MKAKHTVRFRMGDLRAAQVIAMMTRERMGVIVCAREREDKRGPRVINIPFKSTLLATGPKGNCDRFTTRARIDITVRAFLNKEKGFQRLINS